MNKNTNDLLNILVVDDDTISIDVMKLFLRGFGNVDISISGEDAITKINQKKYDIVLLDINLGKGLTGIDIIKIIKQKPEYKNVPILAVTAFAMKGDKEEFLSSGFDFYLAKPFTREELRATIKRFTKQA